MQEDFPPEFYDLDVHAGIVKAGEKATFGGWPFHLAYQPATSPVIYGDFDVLDIEDCKEADSLLEGQIITLEEEGKTLECLHIFLE